MAEFPVVSLLEVADPAGTDPTLAYPLLDPVIPTELVVADSPTTSPENRVSEFLDSRTESLRVLVNAVVENINALLDNFLHRDGQSATTNNPAKASTGELTFTDNPSDGDTVTINDGFGTIVVFEFDDDDAITEGNVAVEIESSAALNATALRTAINAQTELGVTAAFGGAGIIRLTNDETGALGNQAITATEASEFLTIEGLSGGLDEDANAPVPSFMRGNLDMGGNKIEDLAPGTDAQDLVVFDQYEDVLFGGQDDVEQVVQTQIVALDGSIQMGASVNAGSQRFINVASPPVDDAHLQPKDHFDGQVTSFVSDYLNLNGTAIMTGDLSLQVSPTDPRYLVTNLADATDAGDLVNVATLNAEKAAIGGNDLPVGTILPFGGPVAEIDGPFLPCDGREVSRTVYQNLFLVIGTRFGTPGNVNVFKLPDFRGRIPVGLDNMPDEGPADRITATAADTLGGQRGQEDEVLIVDNLPPHTHSIDDILSASDGAGVETGSADENNTNTLAGDFTLTGTAGSSEGHPNVQPVLATLYMIRF